MNAECMPKTCTPMTIRGKPLDYVLTHRFIVVSSNVQPHSQLFYLLKQPTKSVYYGHMQPLW
jgi:hypothetical protein